MESYITAIVANSNMYQINLIEWSNPRCVVPLRKELLSQSEKVYEGVAHRKGHTTTQMSSQQVVNIK